MTCEGCGKTQRDFCAETTVCERDRDRKKERKGGRNQSYMNKTPTCYA